MSRYITLLSIMFLVCFCLSVRTGHASELRSAEAPQSIPGQPPGQSADASVAVNTPLNKESEKILLDTIQNGLPGSDRAMFILGRLYKEAGDFGRAEQYLTRSAETYPLMKDYALKLLVEVYLASGKNEEALQAARRIENDLLLKYAAQSEISALLSLGREDEAVNALSRYVERYPKDWERKMSLARLLKKKGDKEQTVILMKSIYLNAAPLSQEALNELKLLKADRFTKEELLKRADNLFKNGNYPRAESTFREALGAADDVDREAIILSIGRCQFSQKYYGEAAKTFARIRTPEAMYWQAQALYRRSDEAGFEVIKKEFESIYPDNNYLALLLLMDADELRRNERFGEAERIYRSVLERFPEKAEDALWGMGWLNYITGDYKNAYEFFSRLTSYVNSRDFYKYLFWMVRSQEKIVSACGPSAPAGDNDLCGLKDYDFFQGLFTDESYYGYLIKLRQTGKLPEKIAPADPEQPD
ncbi:MAG: tetratricopeptide repeat protein, partial [Nitrospirota bacterium]